MCVYYVHISNTSNMSTQIPYTTTIPSSIMQWLADVARKNKTTKKAILVRALVEYKDAWMAKNLTESFQRAATDEEVINMAEEGLDDALEQLKSFSL